MTALSRWCECIMRASRSPTPYNVNFVQRYNFFLICQKTYYVRFKIFRYRKKSTRQNLLH